MRVACRTKVANKQEIDSSTAAEAAVHDGRVEKELSIEERRVEAQGQQAKGARAQHLDMQISEKRLCLDLRSANC